MFKAAALTALAQGADVKSDHWAIIVAGSRGFGNYRHQADACHAYQIFKKHGIPEEQIIHINYDDVANNTENKNPGTLFNKPTPKGTPGVNVYEGCKIDYKGKDATTENIFNIF
jgi:legumain